MTPKMRCNHHASCARHQCRRWHEHRAGSHDTNNPTEHPCGDAYCAAVLGRIRCEEVVHGPKKVAHGDKGGEI
jgi:hypothetical protein